MKSKLTIKAVNIEVEGNEEQVREVLRAFGEGLASVAKPLNTMKLTVGKGGKPFDIRIGAENARG